MRAQYNFPLPLIIDDETTPDPLHEPTPSSPTASNIPTQSILDALESITSAPPSNESVDSFSTSAYLDLTNALSSVSQQQTIPQEPSHVQPLSPSSNQLSQNDIEQYHLRNLDPTHQIQQTLSDNRFYYPTSSLRYQHQTQMSRLQNQSPLNMNMSNSTQSLTQGLHPQAEDLLSKFQKSEDVLLSSTLGSPVSDTTHPFSPVRESHNQIFQSNHTSPGSLTYFHSNRMTQIAAPIKKSRSRKSRNRKNETPHPSRFCHICARTQKSEKVYCNNLGTERKCRKAVCEPCFKELRWDFQRAKQGGWICPHCAGACSGMPRARCHIYRKTNQRRKAGREQAAAAEKNRVGDIESTTKYENIIDAHADGC